MALEDTHDWQAKYEASQKHLSNLVAMNKALVSAESKTQSLILELNERLNNQADYIQGLEKRISDLEHPKIFPQV